jgi:hypothetical protein
MTDLFAVVQAFMGGVMGLLTLVMLPVDAGGVVDWSLMPQQPYKALIWFGLVWVFVPRIYGTTMYAITGKTARQRRLARQFEGLSNAAQGRITARYLKGEYKRSKKLSRDEWLAKKIGEEHSNKRSRRRKGEQALPDPHVRLRADKTKHMSAIERDIAARAAESAAAKGKIPAPPGLSPSGDKGPAKGGKGLVVGGEFVRGKTLRKRKTHGLYSTARGYVIADASGHAVGSFHADEGAALAALDALAPTAKKRVKKARESETSPEPEQAAAPAPAANQGAAPGAAPAPAASAAAPVAPVAQGDPHTRAFGSDPNRVYDFRFRVVELDDLIASNTEKGGINPNYDPTLQPRQRDRAASTRQIEQMSKNLVPEAYLWDFKTLDKGAPIIGADSMVESGNGRTLALRRARDDEGERWQAYQTALAGQAAALGIAGELEGKAAPVLVRERLSDVDRAAFAREANAPPVLQMSPLEQARVDAGRVSDAALLGLTVREGQGIDQALRAASNRKFVQSFLGSLEENESAVLMRKDGTLNQMGIWRMKAALFTRAFPGESGERIAETFLEALDSDTKNFENAISATLPRISRVEALIASGQREEDMAMIDDVSRSLDVLARLREQDMLPTHYVEQSSLFERELTPFQERLLLHFDTVGKKPKQIRAFFNAYADLVEEAPHKGQVDMFGDRIAPTKDQLLDRILERDTVHA